MIRLVAFLLVPVGLLLSGPMPVAKAQAAQATTLPLAVPEGRRTRVSLNEGWRFLPQDAKGAEHSGFNDARWVKINLPHTWNIEDMQDDSPGYRMGVGWYRKFINLAERLKGEKLFLYFEGANQSTEVFINGKLAGQHHGGYTAFVFDITPFITFDSAGNRNVIAVKVDNGINENIPPSPAADFNLYGGIYRDVWLVATEQVHFTMLDHASPGIYVDTPNVSTENATARIRGTIVNSSNRSRPLRVLNRVVDATGRTVAQVESMLTVEAGREAGFHQTSPPIRRPQLWSPETPYLYSLKTQLYDGNRILDEVSNPLGFRWFSFHPDQGFFLNGNPYKLRGTNRHQDYFGLGNAVPNEIHVKDLERIKEMGFNCILLAHYPQDPVVLETADRLGLFVWEELPLVREISTSKEFANNCTVMLTEMIRQHYNHPSIIMWCLMNEIFLKMRYEPGYVRQVVALARTLDELARKEDPTRVTVISANRPYDNTDIYNASGLLNIPHVVGWHMYFGWYYEDFAGLGKFLDDDHRRFPKRILFVSEYGADADPRIHSLQPRRGDLSSEWARLYHESYLPQLEQRAYLGGSAVWAQHDFGSEARGESMPHLNSKGLFTFNRQPKDIYYFYKASFSSIPVLHIATRDWSSRTGTGTKELSAIQPVDVYTNLPVVELFANRKSLGAKPVGPDKKVTWAVPFVHGLNVLEARGRTATRQVIDRAEVRFAYRSTILVNSSFPFQELAVNAGSTAQYIDKTGLVWEADQPYTRGSWGCTGGVPASTNRNIIGSADDPLYQSVIQGLTSCRFDVPDGTYEVDLRFVEHRFQQPGERVFSVSLNGNPVITNLDLVKEHGALRAEARTFQVAALQNQGVTIKFSAISGEAVLSAIRIRKLK